MGDVGATDRQMDAGSRPKPAQAQRDPEDDLTTAPSARAAEAANALVLVRLSLYFASAQLQHASDATAACTWVVCMPPTRWRLQRTTMASTRGTTRLGEARTKV